MGDTVAITIDDNSPAIVVPRDAAQDVYNKYLDLTLTHPMDLKLFAALTVGLGVMSKPELAYSTGQESFAEIKLREWKEKSQ
jgi:hypothetical protein